MAKFCESCGTPYEEGTTFCSGCGKNLGGAPAPKKAVDNSPIGMVKQYLMIIVAVVAVFALIAGIMNLFATYDVDVTAEYGGYEATNSGALSDLREDSDDMYTMYILSTYLMGIVGLATAGLAGYTAYLLYSKAAGSKKFFSLTGLVGTAGSALALILAFIGRTEEMYGASATLSINFTYFVMLILCGALLALDKTILKSDYAPLK